MVAAAELPCPGAAGRTPLKSQRQQQPKRLQEEKLLLKSVSSRWGKAVGYFHISDAVSAVYEFLLWEIFVLQCPYCK